MTESLAGKPLVLRADANSRIGTGHVMRCLALAQAWQDAGGRALLLIAPAPTTLLNRLEGQGLEVLHLEATPGSPFDARETAAIAQNREAAWVVADGYHFGADYQRNIKDAGLRLLCIDDYGHAAHYSADLVLNQNIHATPEMYASREPYTRLLLGLRYVLLRREFWPWRDWRREIPQVGRKVMVSLGGGDPDNVTLKVMQALARVPVPGLEAVVVVGGANPHLAALQATAATLPYPLRLESNITNMPELMAWADVAVIAGGSTCWETAFMGLFSLTIILSDNQRLISEQTDKFGLSWNLGWFKYLSQSKIIQPLVKLPKLFELRKEMAENGRKWVDGIGSERVIRELSHNNLRLRLADEGDCRKIWEWSNEPEVRAVSFSSDEIHWESHKKWFLSMLEDPDCIFFIAEIGHGNYIGQIRFEISGTEAVVSVSLDKNYRGKRYGSEIIRLGSQKIFSQLKVSRIFAHIKESNESSLRVFKKVGFINNGTTIIQGQKACIMVLEAKRL